MPTLPPIAQPPRTSPLSLTTHEINILIAEYLSECNLSHSAFTFKLESKISTTTPSELKGLKIERGALVRWLHRGLCWSEVESHVTEYGPKPPCSAPFTLLKSHKCVPYFSPTEFDSSSPSLLDSLSASAAELPPESSTSKPIEPSILSEKEKEKERDREVDEKSGQKQVREKPKEKEPGTNNGTSNGKGKRKASISAPKPAGEENGKAANGVSGLSSKRARVESPPQVETPVASKKTPGHLPLPSFSRKTSNISPNLVPKSNTTSKASSKPPSPSTTTTPLPILPATIFKPSKTISPDSKSRPVSVGSTSITPTSSATKRKRPSPSNATGDPSASNSAGNRAITEGEEQIYGTDYTDEKHLKEVPLCKDGEVASFKSHTGEVFVCAFGIREGILATGAGDASVRLWEFSPPAASSSTWSVKEPPIVCKHLPATDKKDITSIEFNPSGTLIGTASYDGIARIWTPEGELHGVLTRHSGPVFSLKFNPKGSLIATAGSDGSVCVWDAVTARLKQCYEFHSDCCLDVDWFDNETLASASKDKTIQICRVGSSIPFRTLKGHTDEINRVQWSPLPTISTPSSSTFSQRVLASCSDDATVRIWSLDGDDKPPFDRAPSFDESSFLIDGGSGRGGKLEKYCLGVLKGHEKEIYSFAWSPRPESEGLLLATGSFDETIRIWDISTLTCIRVLRAHTQTVFSLSFSRTGKYLASAGWDGLVVIWSIESGEAIRYHKVTGEAGVYEIEWSKHGQVIAVCQADKIVTLISVSDLE